mmetsp:Transcript_19888/g.66224  ORF Transcript_19888/g.66224 Transcript_19888/m.66224 type:complete len:249 (-) Transcript_19888:863-1609(-)
MPQPSLELAIVHHPVLVHVHVHYELLCLELELFQSPLDLLEQHPNVVLLPLQDPPLHLLHLVHLIRLLQPPCPSQQRLIPLPPLPRLQAQRPEHLLQVCRSTRIMIEDAHQHLVLLLLHPDPQPPQHQFHISRPHPSDRSATLLLPEDSLEVKLHLVQPADKFAYHAKFSSSSSLRLQEPPKIPLPCQLRVRCSIHILLLLLLPLLVLRSFLLPGLVLSDHFRLHLGCCNSLHMRHRAVSVRPDLMLR